LNISDEFEKVFVSNKLNISCEIFEKKLKKDAVKLSKKIQHSACKVALWGAVSDLSVLYELFQMKDWNIKYIFDSSKYKIGIEHYGCVIKNIKDISFFRDDIDLVVTPISSVNHIMLVKQLKENGYDGELINIGKYRIITKI